MIPLGLYAVVLAIALGALLVCLLVGTKFVDANHRIDQLLADNDRLRQQVQTADEAAEALLRPHPKLAVPPTYLFRDQSFLEECLAATDPAFLAGPAPRIHLTDDEVNEQFEDLRHRLTQAGDDLR